MTKLNLIIAQFWRIIVKRKLIIIYTAFLLLALSAAYAVWDAFPPLYKSTCSIKFEKEAAVGGLFSKILSSPGGNDIETQQVIITSYDLLVEVAGNLSLISGTGSINEPEVHAVIDDLRSKVTFEKEDASNIIHISVTDKDPAFAQKMANDLAETYSRQQSGQQQKRLKEVINYIEEQLETTKDKLQESEEQVNRFSQDNQLILIDHQSGNLLLRKKELEDKISAETDTKKISKLRLDIREVDAKINDLTGKQLEFNRLKKEVDTSRSMASFLEEKKQEAMIRLAEKPDVLEIVKRAQFPSTPVNPPDIAKICLTGLIAGILLGLITALLSEIFSRQIRLIDEIEKHLGIRVLGVIPLAGRKKVIEGLEKDQEKRPDESAGRMYINLVSHFAPKTMISESIRALRTNVLITGGNEKARTIAVTSSYPREGKSMVSANLAVSLAQAGLKTLLVGVDFRNPAMGEFFSIEDGQGLTEILLGTCPWEDTLKTVTDMVMGRMTMDDLMLTPGLDNLNIITSGSVPANPTELLNSPRFIEFIEDAKEEYDIIILDSAPVLTTADTAILGVQVDAILITYRPGFVSKENLKRTFSQLKQVKCNILGVILNGVKPDLIPGALRKKYSGSDSANTSSVTRETTAVKDKKKNSLTKTLILTAVLALLITGTLWKMGILFPEKQSPVETEVKKADKSPAVVEPAEKESLPGEEESIEKSEVPLTVETTQEEPPVSAEEEIKIENRETFTAPEEIKPEYHEGSYPYSIYLGSFKTVERAETAVRIYSEREIDSYPVKLDFGEKGIWYRVYSGYYRDAESARAFIEENKIKEAEVKKTLYACYIDNFTDNATLENSVNILKEKQFFPYVITDHIDNIHFLFTGAFLSRSGAEELSEELKNAGINNRVVLR